MFECNNAMLSEQDLIKKNFKKNISMDTVFTLQLIFCFKRIKSMKMFASFIVFLDFYKTVNTNANVIRELLKLAVAKIYIFAAYTCCQVA